MGRERIETLAGLLEDVFERRSMPDPWAEHSLLLNLRDVGDDDWFRVPPGGGRDIAGIAWHVGASAYMYADSMFGPGNLTWGALAVEARSFGNDRDGFIEWIRSANGRLVDRLRALPGDTELQVPRKAHWGELHPTEQIIRAMIEHFTYHAGEINHLRALLQGTDRWPGAPARG